MRTEILKNTVTDSAFVCEQRYPLHSWIPQRNREIQQYKNKEFIWSEKTYTISANAQNLIVQNHYSVSDYTRLYGMQLQHSAHHECLDIIEQLTRNQQKPIIPVLVNFVEAGRVYNQAGFVNKAYAFLDVCWVVLDYTAAIGEGIIEGVASNIHAMMHPIETMHNLAQLIVVGSHCLSKVLAFYGEIFIWRDVDRLIAMSDEFDAVYNALVSYIKEHPSDAVKQASSCITQALLMHNGMKALHSFFEHAALQLPHYIEFINAGLPLLCPQVVSQFACAAIATQAASTTIRARKVCGDIALLSEAVSTFGPYIPLSQHLPALETIYKNSVQGFGVHANTYVEWEGGVRHFFEPNVKQTRSGKLKVDGFHHDWNNYLENTGQVKLINKVMCQEGFYKADVLYKGVKDAKTFFPSDWPPEKVIRTIINFYEKYKHTATIDRGVWKIEQELFSGIILRLIISQNMELITAYPLL
jgi:hypothetical protein